MPHSHPLREITQEEIDTYNKDGIVCLRGLFSQDWVEQIREAADYSMSNPGEFAIELAAERGDQGRFFHDIFVWRYNEMCKDFVFNSPAAEITGKIMNSNKVNIFFDQWLIKEPGTNTATPWHHDMPYWPIKGWQISTLWLALDPVEPGSGAVEYVKGSHKWGKTYKPATFSGSHEYDDALPDVPDVEAMRDELEFIQFEMEPGDCTVHQGLIVHGAPGNSSSKHRRRAYVSRWAGDDAVLDIRDGVQEMPPMPDLPNGSPLDSELWPRIIG